MMSTHTWHPGLAASAAVALVSIVMLAIMDLSPALQPAREHATHASLSGGVELRADAAAGTFSELRVPIETADGTVTSLAATNGRVRIASLFYTHCAAQCPLTIATIRGIERGLPGALRARLGVLLLSLDPVRDSPPMLAALRARHGLDARWLVGRTDPQALGQLTSVFGTRVTRTAGVIDHTPALLLLDEHGAVLMRSADVTGGDAGFVAALRTALAVHGS